jgi:Zn-finger protein
MQKPESRDPQSVTALEAPSSYRYFSNPSCEFYPCHKTGEVDSFNCLFCYCPLYAGECPGEPVIRIINGHSVKDCSDCQFPHHAENYDDIIRCLMERIS